MLVIIVSLLSTHSPLDLGAFTPHCFSLKDKIWFEMHLTHSALIFFSLFPQCFLLPDSPSKLPWILLPTRCTTTCFFKIQRTSIVNSYYSNLILWGYSAIFFSSIHFLVFGYFLFVPCQFPNSYGSILSACTHPEVTRRMFIKMLLCETVVWFCEAVLGYVWLLPWSSRWTVSPLREKMNLCSFLKPPTVPTQSRNLHRGGKQLMFVNANHLIIPFGDHSCNWECRQSPLFGPLSTSNLAVVWIRITHFSEFVVQASEGQSVCSNK